MSTDTLEEQKIEKASTSMHEQTRITVTDNQKSSCPADRDNKSDIPKDCKKIDISNEYDVDELKFLRVIDPDHIPTYLVEQIKERDYEVERFYHWQRANATISKDGIRIPNPYNHLWVLVDKNRKTKGFVWCTTDTLTKDLMIQNFSVDKNYWKKGEAVRKLKDHLLQVMNENGLPKAVWFSKRPKAYEKYGFVSTKTVMMEYKIKD